MLLLLFRCRTLQNALDTRANLSVPTYELLKKFSFSNIFSYFASKLDKYIQFQCFFNYYYLLFYYRTPQNALWHQGKLFYSLMRFTRMIFFFNSFYLFCRMHYSRMHWTTGASPSVKIYQSNFSFSIVLFILPPNKTNICNLIILFLLLFICCLCTTH